MTGNEHKPAATLRGHPVGLAFLSATELAERFSYYGMTALLTLYMVGQLLLPGHEENVLGLAALRRLFEFRGPMSDQAFASLVYGWYGGLVYFTPLAGGWIADRWLGVRKTVIVGALLMTAGHLAMTFDESFLIALLLLIIGSGCLKGNISAQVGLLYPDDAESLRARGFTIFSTAINIGAVVGPLAAGGAAAAWGWHSGFAIAAGLMLIALAVYLSGQRHMPDAKPKRSDRTELPPLTREERKRSWALIAVVALTIFPNIAYPMLWSIGLVWIDQHVSLASPFGPIPASWFNSVDSFASILAAAPLVALWTWQARRKAEPGNIVKIAIGSTIVGASALLLVAGCLFAGPDGKVSVLWALAAYAGMGTGFMYYWPINLALVSQAAPAKLRSTLMGGVFMSLFVGTTTMGWVGSFYGEMSDAAFWAIDSAIALAGAAITFAAARPLARAMGPANR
jgi:POT family proton-dependent oligopeptide transporter